MSEALKTKYEVLKIIRDNIMKGLSSYGEPVWTESTPAGWQCMENNQPSYDNFDKVVLLTFVKSARVGLPSVLDVYNPDTKKYDHYNRWIEQQEWEVKVMRNRKMKRVDPSEQTTSDIATLLASWFNDAGCGEFRKNNCGNLFVQMKDIKTYQDNSALSQMQSSFVLKLQVPKMAVSVTPSAGVEYGGSIAV